MPFETANFILKGYGAARKDIEINNGVTKCLSSFKEVSDGVNQRANKLTSKVMRFHNVVDWLQGCCAN